MLLSLSLLMICHYWNIQENKFRFKFRFYASGRQRAIQETMSVVDPYTQGVEESIPQTAEKVPGQPPSRLVTQTDCPHHPTARKRESICPPS